MPKQPTVNNNEEMAIETRRITANEIFDAAVDSAREELKRSTRTLAFSGLAGGLTMGLTGLSVAATRAILGSGSWEELASYMVYRTGFIAVVMGAPSYSPRTHFIPWCCSSMSASSSRNAYAIRFAYGPWSSLRT
jgi:hypothetical protein